MSKEPFKKKEPSKAWLEFRAKAGAKLKKSNAKAGAVLKKVGAQVWAALKRAAIATGKFLTVAARYIWRWLKANFAMEPREALQVVKNGLLAQNPLLVLTLGVTCALAATADLRSAAAMACCTLGVLLVSELVVSLLRNVLPQASKRVCALVITAAAVTAAGLVLRVAAPAEEEGLGVYLPLLAVNCAVLSRVDKFAGEHTPGYALLDAVSNGLGYGAALMLLGAARELLGTGSLWGRPVFGAEFHGVLLMVAPCGGFLLLGLLTAIAQWIRNLAERKGGAET